MLQQCLKKKSFLFQFLVAENNDIEEHCSKATRYDYYDDK